MQGQATSSPGRYQVVGFDSQKAKGRSGDPARMDVAMSTRAIVMGTLISAFLLFVPTTVIVAQELNAGPDVIVLTNGDSISGHLLKAGAESVVLENDILGIVTIPSASVSSVRHGSQPSVLQTGVEGKTIPEPALRTADHKLENSQAANASSVTGSRFDGQPAHETSQTGNAPASPGKASGSSIQVSLHAPESVMNGTISQNIFGGEFRLIVRPEDLCGAPSWSTSLLLSGNHNRFWIHGAPVPALTIDQFDGTLSVSNRISKGNPTAFYLMGDMAGNSELGLALQQSYGGGLSRTLYSSGCGPQRQQNYVLVVTGDAGMRYVHDRLNAPAQPVDLASAKVGMKLSYIPFRTNKDGSKAPKFAFRLGFWAMPAVNDLRQTQAGGTTALSLFLSKALTLTFNAEDDYFSGAPKFFRKNFSLTGVTLGYSFPAGLVK